MPNTMTFASPAEAYQYLFRNQYGYVDIVISDDAASKITLAFNDNQIAPTLSAFQSFFQQATIKCVKSVGDTEAAKAQMQASLNACWNPLGLTCVIESMEMIAGSVCRMYVIITGYIGQTVQVLLSTATISKLQTITVEYGSNITVHFDSNGGTAVADQTVTGEAGMEISSFIQPVSTSKSTYSLQGWYYNDTIVSTDGITFFDLPVFSSSLQSITLVAQWTRVAAKGGEIGTSISDFAMKLATACNFTLSGDVKSDIVAFDGKQNVTLNTILSNTGVNAGTYSAVTVDKKGRITQGKKIIERATKTTNPSNLIVGGILIDVKPEDYNAATNQSCVLKFKRQTNILNEIYPKTLISNVYDDEVGTVSLDDVLSASRMPQILLTNANRGIYRTKVNGVWTDIPQLRITVLITNVDKIQKNAELEFCVFRKSKSTKWYTSSSGENKAYRRVRYRYKCVWHKSFTDIFNEDIHYTSFFGQRAIYYTICLDATDKVLFWNFSIGANQGFAQRCIRIRYTGNNDIIDRSGTSGQSCHTLAMTKFAIKRASKTKENRYITIVNY